MKRKKLVIGAGIGILFIMLIIMLYTLINYSQIEGQIQSLVESYGYFAVFLLCFITDVLMQPIGPDVIIVFGILLNLNIITVTILGSIGSVIANFISYYIGKVYGEFGFRRFRYHPDFEKWKRLYYKYGKYALIIGALTPVPFVPMCWLAGIFRMRYVDFVIFGILSRLTRFIAIAYIVHLILMI